MKSSETRKTFTEELKGTVSEIISQVKKIIREGNARRLMIQDKKGKVLFQTQLTAGIAGTALITAMAPIVSAISMFALFMNDVKIVVEKYPDEQAGSSEDGNENADGYEVDAEVVVEIDDEEESDESEGKKKTDKTVGKKKDEDGDGGEEDEEQ